MRRTLPVLLVLTVVLGLASPALAADTRQRSFELRCEQAGGDRRRPAVRCAWDGVDGAVAYRVLRASRGSDGLVVTFRTVSARTTAFTAAIRPGTYVFAVQALKEHRRVLATSNREQVTIHGLRIRANQMARGASVA